MIIYQGLARKVVACSLCGTILVVSANGLICQNMNCPEYLFEKREHLPEKGDTGTSYAYTSTISASGAVASVSTTTTYPYSSLVNFNKGGE